MRLKKLMAGILCATMLLSTGFIFADGTEQDTNMLPINTDATVEQAYLLGSFTATVQEIHNENFIVLADEDGMPINMIVSKDTYIVGGQKIAVGDKVSGYYHANAPMITIYPPQYSPSVVVIENDDTNVKVDMFDTELVSSDKVLKLKISEDTEIVTIDGRTFEGELGNRKLIVIYDASTKSIPAQTNPIKVIVYSQISPQEEAYEKDIADMNMVVAGVKIDAPKPYSNDKGIVMLPLRAIAQGLDLDVVWQDKEEAIRVGENVLLKIGSHDYIDMKANQVALEASPELVDGVTFVPLEFFKQVLHMNNAYVFEGQIDINNEEEMK